MSRNFRIIGGNERNEMVLGAIRELLEANYLMALSTISDRGLWPCTVFYSFDDESTLFFLSNPQTKHGENIARDNRISGCIYDSYTPWGSTLRGLQFSGKVEQLSRKDAARFSINYFSRYAKAKKHFSSIGNLFTKGFSSRPFLIHIDEIQLYDEKTFGPEGIRSVIFE